MKYCHMCGKWREVNAPAYVCSACIDEWVAKRAERVVRSEQTPPGGEQ
jgi:hypothetical protein